MKAERLRGGVEEQMAAGRRLRASRPRGGVGRKSLSRTRESFDLGFFGGSWIWTEYYPQGSTCAVHKTQRIDRAQ